MSNGIHKIDRLLIRIEVLEDQLAITCASPIQADLIKSRIDKLKEERAAVLSRMNRCKPAFGLPVRS